MLRPVRNKHSDWHHLGKLGAITLTALGLSWPAGAAAEWRSVQHRDRASLAYCNGGIDFEIDRRTGRTRPRRPPIRQVLECNISERRAAEAEADREERRRQQVEVINLLNREWRSSTEHGPVLNKWIHQFRITGLADLYFGATCRRYPRCIRFVILNDYEIYVSDEEIEAPDSAPPFTYAIRYTVIEDQSLITKLRELFGAYRAHPNYPDDREWALLPSFGYPADFFPFMLMPCGEVGREVVGERITTVDGRLVTVETRGREFQGVAFVARDRHVPLPRGHRLELGADNRQILTYWSSGLCTVEPTEQNVRQLFDQGWAEMAAPG